MKLIKLPLKILALPLIVLIKLVCIIAKVITHLTCYIISPVMILVGIILLVMLSQERWTDVWACGAIEGICLKEAAKNRTPEQLEYLRDLVKKAEEICLVQSPITAAAAAV